MPAEWEWTDRLLNIPRVLASRRRRPGTQRHDDAVSDGNYALVLAAASYDAGRGSTPEAHAWRRVESALFRRQKPTRAERARALESDAWPDYDAPARGTCAAAAESADAVAWLLAQLPAAHREACRLVWLEGRTHDEAGALLGVSGPRIRQKLAAARESLAGRRPALEAALL